MPARERPDRNLAMELVRVTERAAVASSRWRGRGDEKAADQAAVDAMRRELNKLPIDGTVVIGDQKSAQPHLAANPGILLAPADLTPDMVQLQRL